MPLLSEISPLLTFILQALAASGVVAAIPRIAAIWTKKKHLDTRSEIDRFEATLGAQDKMLVRANERIAQLEKELEQERTERVAERDYFFEQLARANKRLSECEGILERKGWQEPRKSRRDGGGGKTG
jgi:septal ring factor EnvC (AmiA/AmiB activator)